MDKTLSVLAAVTALALAAGAYWLVQPGAGEPRQVPRTQAPPVDVGGLAPSQQAPAAAVTVHAPALRNSTVLIEGTPVTLKNGVSIVPGEAGSAASSTTRYVGFEARGDLTGDGRDDTAFIVTQDRGGSGRFYYVVVGVATAAGYQPTNAFFIGDRITPQALIIPRGASELHVKFAERAKGEPMTSPPSQDAVLLLKVTREGVLEGLMR